jgi:predicted enzyme related to lactoylglutathione lyase
MMRRPATPICAVLVHVPDWREGLAWYRRAFPSAKGIRPEEGEWECIEVDGVQIEVVPADEKVPSGSAGTVVYWFTDDFEQRVEDLKSIGAILYRGPLEIEDGLTMCQLKDPFGNLIGIRGPRRVTQRDACPPPCGGPPRPAKRAVESNGRAVAPVAAWRPTMDLT